MSPDHLFLVPLALGHLALFVVAMNVVHALGHPERTLDKAKLVALALFASLSAVLAWEAWGGPLSAWSWPSLAYGSVCILTGLLAVPAASAYLHHRPRPVCSAGRESVSDFTEGEGPRAFIGGGRYAWLLGLPGNESLRLRTVDCELPLANLPGALDGLSVLHLSDMHLATCFDRRYFESVVDAAAGLPADLVAFTGDLLDDDAAAGWIVPLFSRLRGRLGSFAILGNHDLSHDPARLRGLLEEAGFVDLEGRWAAVEDRGLTVALGGTSYPWGPPLPQADRPRADFRILLSHAPDQFYRAERLGFDLMLSGHNHGGQVRFPLVGPVFMPSVYSRRFDRGFFRKGKLTLHVSQGVAGKHPVRYGCLPEIHRIVLRSIPAGSPGAIPDPAYRSHGQGRSRTGDQVR